MSGMWIKGRERVCWVTGLVGVVGLASVASLAVTACDREMDTGDDVASSASATASESVTEVTSALRHRACTSSVDCQSDQFCTTETGVCNPPPGCHPRRPGVVCADVCYGTCQRRVNVCRNDSDCRAFSDTCTGCDCRALSSCQKDPVCSGPGVQCFVDPCFNKEAFCDGGRCSLRDARTACAEGSCGPPLGLPNFICADGTTVAGPSGRCLSNAAGTCGWEVISCPDRAVCR